MERDLAVYPDNETGDLLWSLVEAGVDLGQPYEVEFSVIFEQEQQALNFGRLLLENNQKLSFSPYNGSDSHPWEITAYPSMPLSIENIDGYTQLLQENSAEFAGVFDGWYTQVLQLLSE
ncbi:ribonuclease E inhibitor RraB [Thalassotalea sp. LPB0316]|uniref:ribonuclease E inhibitor RraB n=1 Tax=Thalassotalea sp. LPB0316 TaxID=2769490 RepID=UPI001866FC4E|nr:ribonuclease E inhibitor RraB [Thalassotalea sp. LPB0316]QOL25706.1 ribonuclease E inhibitor RraB [Thalassotalea sp. LPB0316]